MTLQTHAAPARRSFIPFLFPLGLLLVIAVNMGMLWIALDTFPGVVTRNAYEKGRRYNQVIELEAVRDRLGWKVEMVVPPGQPWTIEARFRDGEGKPIDGLSPMLAATRPLGPPMTREIVMLPVGAGTYRASPDMSARGVWMLTVTAVTEAGVHQSTLRVNVE